ncbi:hypothetical protein CLAIMM_09782 [Cladophialophora immunda]|nr:hypothetical protein CLAIMM_09782 [Cladophialophora immunda]
MSRIQGERVFCHQCQNEWDRAHGGLTCPRCEGDFTEILEPGEAPSTYDLDRPPSLPLPVDPPSPPTGDLHDHTGLQSHNPWAEDANDDDGTNFTTFEFTTTGGGGRMVLSTRSWRGDGRNNRGMPAPFVPLSPFGFPRGQGAGGLDDPHFHLQPAGLQDLFSLILQSMQPEGLHGPDPDDRRRGGQPPLPFDLLHQMLNPANARTGDMVYSQEAFDRVMTQLMEQHNASTAPPPASEEAILSLKKKKVDREMLGEEGKAECSICMDNVELNNENMIPAPTVGNPSRIRKIDCGRDLQDGDTAGEHRQYQVHVPMALKPVDTTQRRFQRLPARYEKSESHITAGDMTTMWNALKPIAMQALSVT